MKKMTIRELTSALAIIAATAWSAHANASPQVNQTEVTDDTITIYGIGFGKKLQGPPVLWAFGKNIIENGVPVPKETNVIFGNPVPVGSEKNLNIWSRGTGATFSNITRTPEVSHTYRATNEGWLGWPHAFGADDTPFSEKAYISWRLKPDGDINSYKVSQAADVVGNFIVGESAYSPGEKVLITSSEGKKIDGRIVYLDKDKSLIHIEAASLQSSDASGARILGLTSGASATLQGDAFFRSSISGKYLRSYETLNQGGTHSVLSTNRWISVQFDSKGTELRRGFETETDAGYGVPEVSATSDWQLLEAYIDLSKEYGSGYISLNNNQKKWFKNLYIGDSKPKDSGPTISNIGWEPAGGTEIINVALNFGEIYFDNTPQRVILSSQQEFSEVRSDQELLYIQEWNDQKIVASLRTGGLKKNSPLYLFVFNENNDVNSKGVCIKNCDLDLSPPSKIDLGID